MANEKKQVIITNQMWCDIMNRIHTGSSCFTEEAEKLGLSLSELLEMGNDAHKDKGNKRWQEWCKTKRESSKRDKNLSRLRRRKTSPKHTPALTAESKPAPTQKQAPKSEPAPASTPESDPGSEIDQLEFLLLHRKKLQEDLSSFESQYKLWESILKDRTDKLTSATSMLKNAQETFEKAKNDKAEAEIKVSNAKTSIWQMHSAIISVNMQIKDISASKIYLVDPWFSGKLPECGTFISTVEMEGIRQELVPEEYMPETSLKDVFLFNYVPDYKKALVFCGLVCKYELEDKPYTLLVTDERVKELLKMYIWSTPAHVTR